MVEKQVKEEKKTTFTSKTGDRGLPKVREGVVVSDKMSKTVVVAIVKQVKHPTYGKYVRRTNKYFVHDPKEESGVGDLVSIVETRPLSKMKRWKLAKVITKAVLD